MRYTQAFQCTADYEQIKVNLASSGHVTTDLTHHRSSRISAEGARIIAHLATLPAGAPSGGYFSDPGAKP